MNRNFLIVAFALFCFSCAKAEDLQAKPDSPTKPKGKVNVEEALNNAVYQYLYMKEELNGTAVFPKTYNKDKKLLETSNSQWWCSGFYPGTLYYLYEATGNKDLYKE